MSRVGQNQALELVDGRVRALRVELSALGDQYDNVQESELARNIAKNRRDRPLLGLLLAEKVLRRALLSGSSSGFEDFLFRFGAHVKASVGLQGLGAEDRVALALGARDVFMSSSRMSRQVTESDEILDRLPDVEVSDIVWRRQFGMTREEFRVKVALVSGQRRQDLTVPNESRPRAKPQILRERPVAADGELSIPTWLSLPVGPSDGILLGSRNWPILEPTEDGPISLSRAWTAFEEGRYEECREELWDVFATCGINWYPTGTQDGMRTWNWLRLVWLLGQQATNDLRNRRRALVSAVLLVGRSVPTELDLIDSLVSGALGDYVAVEPEMRSSWAVHAARTVVAAGPDALGIYDGAGKADLRAAWEEQFGDVVAEMRQTHQMAEALVSEYKFRAQELSQAVSPDGQAQRRLVPPLRRIEIFLDPEECALSQRARDLATSLATQLAKESPLVSDLAMLKTQLSRLQEDVAQSESVLLQDTLGRAVVAMSATCDTREAELSSVSRPHIVASLLTGRLPLSSTVQAPFSVSVALRNDGNATAELVEATLASLSVEIVEPLRVVERIPAGAERVVRFEALSLSDESIALLQCELTWRDDLEQTFTAIFNLRAEDQRPTAWRADDVNPFRLGTISNPAYLVGRDDDLDALERISAAGGSAAVTGLKRVGKSSLAKSLLSRMKADGWATDYLPLGQVLTGDPSASELVTALIDTIFDAIVSTDSDILVPEPPKASSESFTRTAGRWIRQTANVAAKHDLHVLVALDDFDELPKQLYEGPEANALFLFLRSIIDESWLSLMFIGSEVLPTILGAQAHKLNQVATAVVSNFQAAESTKLLLEGRTKSRFEWQDASFTRAHFLCAGNPYYLTLLGQEIWQYMRDLDRTFVSVGDVQEAANRLESSASSTHFLHLWADSVTGLVSRSRAAVVANAVLVSVARGSGPKYGNTNRAHVAETAVALVPSATAVEIASSIATLLSRGVLLGGDDLLRVGIPVASGWLRKTGAGELERQLVELREISESRNSVSSLDLLNLTDGLTYCGDHVSEVRVKGWLEQFPNDVQHLAFRAARRMLTDGYFSNTRMTQEVLPRLKAAVTASEAWGAREADSGGYAKNVYVLEHGLAGSSSPGFFSTITRLLKIKKTNVVDIDKFLRATRNVSRPSVLLIADDLAGTGSQLTKVMDDAITRISTSSGAWRENLHIVMAAAISATDDFPERDDVNVETVIGVKLGSKHLAYAEDNEIFDNVDDSRRAVDIFDAIGRSLSPNTPRGFGDLGLLAATESNCPNNAPPMFWKSGEYAGRKWMPLLERRL
jgi:hypothetical protein